MTFTTHIRNCDSQDDGFSISAWLTDTLAEFPFVKPDDHFIYIPTIGDHWSLISW